MINNLLTILVAVAKIGSLYARNRRDKQYFQTAAILLIMIIIVKNDQKKQNNNKYNRYYGRSRSNDEF